MVACGPGQAVIGLGRLRQQVLRSCEIARDSGQAVTQLYNENMYSDVIRQVQQLLKLI